MATATRSWCQEYGHLLQSSGLPEFFLVGIASERAIYEFEEQRTREAALAGHHTEEILVYLLACTMTGFCSADSLLAGFCPVNKVMVVPFIPAETFGFKC